MDTLAIPPTISSTSGLGRGGPGRHARPLRSTRSSGSLRTPNSSTQDAMHPSQLRSMSLTPPPDLTFSSSSLAPEQEADFLSGRRLYGTTSSSSSRGSHAVPPLAVAVDVHDRSPSQGKDDSWRSSASGKGKRPMGRSRIRLDSVFGTSLPGFPYLNSAAAATSTPALAHPMSSHFRPPSSQELRSHSVQSWNMRSASALGSTSVLSHVESTPGNNSHRPVSRADVPEVNTSSCSGGSNSSDDVDLDLSWDMDVLRARQRVQAAAAAARQARKGKQPETSDAPPSDETEAMQMSRLARGKRQSRSALDLRHPEQADLAPLEHHPAVRRSLHQYSTDRSDAGRLAVPATPYQAGSRDYDPSLGWSFATTPPLSAAELVTYAEQTQGNPSSGSFAAGSEGPASRLLGQRRPSFPMMSLIDKAMHSSSSASAQSSPSQESWGSPSLTQQALSPSSQSLPVVTVPGPVLHQAASENAVSPEQSDLASPSPPTLSPETSTYNSPQTNDDLPTPRTGEFNRHSQFSMQSAAEALVPKDQHSSKQRPATATSQNSTLPGRHVKTHVRRSSSLFRFPFISIRSAFRSASPALTQGSSAPDAKSTIPEERADSPGGSSAELPSESGGSHESSNAASSSPPRLGSTKRVSSVITDKMLRPGPNVGKGRLAGLGISIGGSSRQRQSSLPILSFSTPSEEAHGPSNGREGPVPPDANRGEIIQELSVPDSVGITHGVLPSSAPPTTVQFNVHDPPHTSISGQSRSSPVHIQVLRRRRPILNKQPDFDLWRRLDSLQPSQLLFYSAFVLGPWCFIVGGWCLRSIDGDYTSVKGIRCRCPPTAESCECHAEIYQQIRLSGGNINIAINGQPLIPKMDRFVFANRVGAVVSGTVGLVLVITAIIAAAREW